MREVECIVCRGAFDWNASGMGPRPDYCTNKCRQRAYRARKAAKAAGEANPYPAPEARWGGPKYGRRDG